MEVKGYLEFGIRENNKYVKSWILIGVCIEIYMSIRFNILNLIICCYILELKCREGFKMLLLNKSFYIV